MSPLRPTRIRDLAATAIVAGLLAYLLVRDYYGSLPAMPWTPSVALAGLAVLEGGMARATRSRIARRPGTKPVEPLVVARLVALAKATAVVGAVLIGAWAGVFAYTALARDRLAAAGRDAQVSAIGLLVALVLVAAALWLEQACRTPDPPEDDGSFPP
jgi:hypothetical protein